LQNINSLKYYECAIIGTSQIFTYQSDLDLNDFDIVLLQLKNQKKQAIILKEVSQPTYRCKNIIDKIYSLKENEKEFLKFISTYYFTSIGEVVSIFNFQENEILEKIFIKSKINLSNLQHEALQFINQNQISILFGDTGSGKTEIYIKKIEEVINQNKTVIFLLPEIAITSQMEIRLKKHFGNFIEIWHSKITKPKKQKILDNIKFGKTRILVGARSALFLTMPNLGLIIVDEFHDDSYKSQSLPMYNAKDLAIYKAKLYNIPIVLGSATPLVSDIYKHKYFRLRGNFYNSKNRFSFIKTFDDSFEKVKQVLDNNGQVIIFIPTRANFKYMICDSCGKAVKCPYCDVAMSIHSQKRIIKCHYCNYATKIPNTCECGNDSFINDRVGSSEIVEILQQTFLDKNIQKFDRDIITSKTRLDKVLKDFNNKKIDILVGTQMLSKGHDYDVDLAIILDIDFVLNMPDFKARERALSLAIQVAGRAGRRKDGEVVIQTLQEDFFKLSYDDFIKEEIEFRKDLNYPPFSRLAKLEFSDKNQTKAYEEMIKVKNCLDGNIDILGFGESPINKISNKYRYQILIKGKKFHNILWKCKTNKTKIDMDCINFS